VACSGDRATDDGPAFGRCEAELPVIDDHGIHLGG
jgi:hypothetical protein